MKSLQGHLLVASPHLPEPNFYRSVVLMIEHHDEAAVGLILNRTSTKTLSSIWPTISDMPCQCDTSIGIGGPVEGPLMALHQLPELSEFEVMPNVYFTAGRDHLERLVAQPQPSLRIFSGYAGWGPQQLDEEIKIGGWLIMPATIEHIFAADDNTLWQQVTNAIGDQITLTSLGIKRRPENPSLN